MKKIVKALVAGIVAVSAFGAAFTLQEKVAAAEDEIVVYVSDKGNDSASGETASAPKKTLSGAYKVIGRKKGTVVVCGTLTLSGAQGYNFPSAKGDVTITSKYGDKDYAASGAKLVIKNHIYINGNTAFNNITLNPIPALKIFGKGNNLHFGENIKISLISSGSHPYIFGGTYAGVSGSNVANCSFSDYTIQVDSGTWQAVRGGNYRDAGEQPMGYVGNVKIIINGGSVVGTGSNATDLAVISASGFCGLEGDALIEINGGNISCAIFAVGRAGSNSTRKISSFDGNVTVNITGGRFTGAHISAVQEKRSGELDGDFTLNITGGEFTRAFSKINGDGVLGERRVYVNTDALGTKITNAAVSVYISPNGDDANSGLSPETPVKTVAAAEKILAGEYGGALILCGDAEMNGATLGSSLKGDLIVTSVGEGKLIMSGENKFATSVVFRNITVEATNATVNACGNSITAGEGVTVNGELSLDCGEGENTRTLTVHSGTYGEISGGVASKGDVAVLVYGGTAKTVYGTKAQRSGGDVSVVLLGGSVETITAAEQGTAGNCGVALFGGTVNTVNATVGGRISGDFGITLASGTVPTLNANSVVGKKLCSADKGAAVPEGFTNVGRAIFVSDNGSEEADGLSPLNIAPKPYHALKALQESAPGDYAVIILGRYTAPAAVTLPEMGGVYTIGGYFCGINWQSAVGSELRLGAALTMGGDTVIDHLNIVSYTDAAYIAGNCHKLVIGENVTCRKYTERGITKYPSICGGVAITGNSFGGTEATDLTINSGTWHYAFGGHINATDGNTRTIKDSISITVNGGEFYGGVAANGMNNLNGNATLTVNGGVFRCSIFGAAKATEKEGSKAIITGDISVILNRGDFRGDILAAQRGEDVILNGKYSLTMGGGDYSRVNSIRGTDELVEISKAESELNIADNIDTKAEFGGELTVENPIASFADPSVYFHDGWYYYTYSKDYSGKPGLWVTRAPNIADLGCTEPIMIWSSVTTGKGGEVKSLWAPQIYFLDGKWYVYATCSSEGTSEGDGRRPYVWVGKGETPYDGFEYYGTLDNYDEQVYTYLSPRIIEHGGKRYLVCGGFFRASDKVAGVKHYQRLFMGELASPTAFATGMTVISEPTESWEKRDKVSIMEGPFPIYAPDGTLYIAYAAGETSGEEYCTGLLKFKGTASDSLIDRTKWEKLKKPMQFLDYSTKIYSPGAMVFVTQPDGTGLWGIFHVKMYAFAGYTHRVLFTQEVTFVDNVPTMTAPQPVTTTYQMKLNAKPLADRMGVFDKINTVAPSPEPLPETSDPNDTDPVDTSEGSSDPGKTPSEKSAFPVIPVAIGAAVAAVIAVAAAVILKKKKK